VKESISNLKVEKGENLDSTFYVFYVFYMTLQKTLKVAFLGFWKKT